MAKGLTRRQESILRFIIESIRDNGFPPTIAEIGARFDISSTNGVNDHLVALKKKGYIERSSKARGIRVTPKAAAGLYQQEANMVPLVGQVAAGQPIVAEQNIEEHIALSGDLGKRATYCLRVRGESMIDDGILDGDLVVVDQSRTPREGDIVVALVDEDATIKHYYPHGDEVELRPANSTMESLHFPANEVILQGIVVGIQRTLI